MKPTTNTVDQPAGKYQPPKCNPLRYNMVELGNGNTPVAACADSGAEITLISTATLKQAGVNLDWASLPSAPSVRGVG